MTGAARPGGASRRWDAAWTHAAAAALAVVLAAAGCGDGDSGTRSDPGPGIGTTIERTAPPFDAAAAFALLERQVAFGPRVPGTAGHRAQLEWMTAFLRERADTVVLQPFSHRGPSGERLELTNVLARFGPDRRERILLVAHWDTRPTADADPDPDARDAPIPGANDGASGVAVLLQLADVLSRHSPPVAIDILLVDGEDYAPDHMYLGSRYFADHLPRGYEPFYGIVVDMVADRSPRFLEEGFSRHYAPEVVDRVWTMAERLGHGHIFVRAHGRDIMDDHVPLNRAGIPTINIIDFEYGPGNAYWHTHQDDLDNVGPDGLGVVGEVLAEIIFRGG